MYIILMTPHHHIINLAPPQSPMPNAQCPLVLAIGNLDGVHLGHQQLVRTAGALAEAHGHACAVLTFAPHPREYFNPSLRPLTLMRPAGKIKALQAFGVEKLIFATFDHRLAKMEPEAFIKDFCVETLGAHHIVTGDNFYFGRNRRGNIELLEQVMHGLRLGYSCVEPVYCDSGEVISSSRIRQVLSGGNVQEAATLLGRPFTLEGRVGHGDKRGRELGFPTANIPMHGLYLPAFGVYAVRTHVNDSVFNGVANLGIRPTFGGKRPQLEIHLFDMDEELYGKHMSVELRHYLRPEQQFDGKDALVARIHKDIDNAKKLLACG